MSTETPPITPPAFRPISELLQEPRGASTGFQPSIAQVLKEVDHLQAELHRRTTEVDRQRHRIVNLTKTAMRQKREMARQRSELGNELKQLRLLVKDMQSSSLSDPLTLSDSSAPHCLSEPTDRSGRPELARRQWLNMKW